jgi:peptidoglycan hydrolase FlgJ
VKIQNQMPINSDARPTQAQIEQRLHDAASMYEQHFLDQMVKAMRSTIHHEDGLIRRNMGEEIFSEKLDNQYTENWAKNGGIGLSDMIYQQLHERIFPNQNLQKPQGPLPLQKATSPMQIKVDKKDATSGQILFRSDNSQPLVQPAPVTNPWSGRVESTSTADGGTHMSILHDNNVRSRLAFQGASVGIGAGNQLDAGEQVGWLSPGVSTLRWDVKLA